MAKYSTGSSASGGGTNCELCGAESNSLELASVAGAELEVCPDCTPHDDQQRTQSRSSDSDSSRRDDEPSRKQKAAQNVAKANPVWDGDSEHWEEEGTNYDDDPLPYLVSDYGEKTTEARQAAGLQREELAEELGARETDLLAVEQGRATQAGIGGGLIEALEERLDVTLSE
ncbi:helix-turn-helix domain-containing protein [Natronobacterium gregoryi]|uniref:DNA binding domain-containing protein n=2 Tax=Natronobacterium gregoryi TaxID=44930 RepID=L0AJW8_NATGS|nr:multiprotein-bridging factor 1 family protein [Natronobacterium gregoryi]AFZ73355.1 putative transcription factor, MBF1 like protein [Natronobacterium gregoryi SP2]ELY68670.1 DNA binding domain-containing protein [Natronobacterium gregoryi SP2]PLK18780.1 transcriptional regulator [Natronobacterium gregoryi SP2]SFJ63668.1 transcriptional regulator, XRE family [Natronobacterium gregoryi]